MIWWSYSLLLFYYLSTTPPFISSYCW
jgi:hypothetical protein